MLIEQYDDIEFHEYEDTCEVVQGERFRVFSGETAYVDATRFYYDLTIDKAYDLGQKLW